MIHTVTVYYLLSKYYNVRLAAPSEQQYKAIYLFQEDTEKLHNWWRRILPQIHFDRFYAEV